MEFGVEEVKMTLAAHSQLYQEKVKNSGQDVTKINGDGFTNDQYDMAVSVIAQIAQTGDNDNVRLKAAFGLIDEFKGRKDLGKIKNINLTVNQFNSMFARAREHRYRAKRGLQNNSEEPIIEAESVKE